MLTELIRELVAPDSRRSRIRRDQFDAILAQLRAAQERLELKLANETEPAQKRHLALELEVNRLQQRKCVRRQLELKEKSK